MAKAVAVHGVGRYDYSQAVYVNSAARVKILCLVHGIFEQAPSNHINGEQGCPKCGNESAGINNSFNTAKFIERAKAIHGERYDYSLTIYINSQSKLKIICPEHGVFEQTAREHYAGFNCRKCKKGGKPPVLDLETKVARLTEVHGNKYDYSLVPKESVTRSSIPIICRKHGLFHSTYERHIRGSGCPRCARLTGLREDYIEQYIQQHGSKYDYSLLPKNLHAKDVISIICPAHGLFEQEARVHKVHGCAQCHYDNKLSNPGGWGWSDWVIRARGRECLLYCIQLTNEAESFFKIGITSMSIALRFKGKLNKLYNLTVVYCYSSNDASEIWKLEHAIKKHFKHLRYIPIKQFAGSRECYREIEEILPFIKENVKAQL